MHTVIIGGGAGGLSCAARLRRLDNSAQITVLERTDEVSIASCGLPYYISGVIAERANMQVASASMLKKVFDIDVRLSCGVTGINPQTKTVRLQDGSELSYDKLVLAPGAKAFVPNIKGTDNPRCFTVKSLTDADNIKQYITTHNVRTAAVVGGGFIGVEVAENLHEMGIKTTLAEAATQILPPLDSDIVCQLHAHLRQKGLNLCLNDGIKEITSTGIILNSGKEIAADIIILAIGVRPDTAFLNNSGIELTEKGLIKTNEYMQTNIADVYACGDSVAVKDFVSDKPAMIALAGPANRQGRLIADHIAGKPYPYNASQGTGIVKVFDLTAAFTGNNEKQLQNNHIPYEKMLIWASSHAGYYPNAAPLALKILYNQEGKILGAQAVGAENVDKIIDVIATVMRLGGTTADLRDAELCYAPPYSSAKSPVNLVGMAVENIRQKLIKPYFGTDFSNMFVLDVRPPQNYEAEHIKGAVNIPAAQIRARLNELPKDKPILVHCFKGYTSYVICRILMANGFNNVYSYAGGWQQYKAETNDK